MFRLLWPINNTIDILTLKFTVKKKKIRHYEIVKKPEIFLNIFDFEHVDSLTIIL